jgi:hypothetical protein
MYCCVDALKVLTLVLTRRKVGTAILQMLGRFEARHDLLGMCRVGRYSSTGSGVCDLYCCRSVLGYQSSIRRFKGKNRPSHGSVSISGMGRQRLVRLHRMRKVGMVLVLRLRD